MTASTLTDLTASQQKINVAWTDSQGGLWWGYRIYLRAADSPDWTLLYETTTAQGSYSIDLYLYSNATTQHVTVVEVSVESGTGRVIEDLSHYNDYNSFTPSNTDNYYALLHTNPANNVTLKIVTKDDFEEEYETHEMTLLGRGRKVNVGARLGRTGSLTLQLRDDVDSTARVKRQELIALWGLGDPVWLRDPFGDLYRVSLGAPKFSRIEGLGLHEAVDVTLPYSEVV